LHQSEIENEEMQLKTLAQADKSLISIVHSLVYVVVKSNLEKNTLSTD
jgi:hypothetical protein